jgi:hypothetical protein
VAWSFVPASSTSDASAIAVHPCWPVPPSPPLEPPPSLPLLLPPSLPLELPPSLPLLLPPSLPLLLAPLLPPLPLPPSAPLLLPPSPPLPFPLLLLLEQAAPVTNERAIDPTSQVLIGDLLSEYSTLRRDSSVGP